jgi:hypothetical protein
MKEQSKNLFESFVVCKAKLRKEKYPTSLDVGRDHYYAWFGTCPWCLENDVE